MKFLISFIVAPILAFCFSFDKGLDVSLCLDPFNLEKGSRIDINHQSFLETKKHSFILNPRMCAYFDSHVDVSLGMGHRILSPKGILGYHVFYDYSKHSPMYFHQMGWSLEFLTRLFDYRINCYHPIVKDRVLNYVSYQPHHWIEGEISFKSDRFTVGFGPVYNFSVNQPAAKFRITFPLKCISLGAGLECDKTFHVKSFISLGWQLYSFPYSSSTQSVNRSNRVRYEAIEIPYIPPPIESKNEKEKKIDGAYYIQLDKDYVLFSELNVYIKQGNSHKPYHIRNQEELNHLLEIFGQESIFVPVDQISIKHITNQEELPCTVQIGEQGEIKPGLEPESRIPPHREPVESPPPSKNLSWWEKILGI